MFDQLLKEAEKMRRVNWAEKMKFELGLLNDEWSSMSRNETEKVILDIGSKVRITKEEEIEQYVVIFMGWNSEHLKVGEEDKSWQL